MAKQEKKTPPQSQRDGPRQLRDGDVFDRGTNKLGPSQLDRDMAALRGLPREGDGRIDRFEVHLPGFNKGTAPHKFSSAGIVFFNGVGYTASETNVNIARGLGYEVIDRQSHADPNAETVLTGDPPLNPGAAPDSANGDSPAASERERSSDQ